MAASKGPEAAAAASGRMEVNEASVFGRMDLFAKRCRKLMELFTTIYQFSVLAKVQGTSILPEVAEIYPHFIGNISFRQGSYAWDSRS